MPETFLILLCGGVMLAVAVSNPRAVSIHWLRLAGILALSFAGVAVFFVVRRDPFESSAIIYRQVQWGLLAGTILAVLLQLGLGQNLRLGSQRIFALVAFVLGVLVGTGLLHLRAPPGAIAKPQAILLQTLACAGIASMCGLALMDMLLGHAYLTAAKMTIAPFRRLNLVLGAVVASRVLLGIVAIIVQLRFPTELFWQRFGLYLGTRWFVGLVVPAVFVYMAHDCIRRRSTQSATGILYVTGVLIFIGELLALYLTQQTGLPL